MCDEIHNIKDISSLNLRRPIDRGYVVNWDLQKEIWQGRLLYTVILSAFTRLCCFEPLTSHLHLHHHHQHHRLTVCVPRV